jgi:plastocyanin
MIIAISTTTRGLTVMSDDIDAEHVSQRRRHVLQALGIGAVAAAVGPAGLASARTGSPTGSTGIDPNLGYTALTEEDSLPVEPDHEVQVLVGPPANPDQPVPSFYYQPTGLAIRPGDVVAFRFTTGGHTVSAYHPYAGRQQRIPERDDGTLAWFSSPYLGTGATWLYRFDTPGVYDYYCGPHELFGHVGRIVVGDVTASPPVPNPCLPPEESESEGEGPELRPPGQTAALVLRDPALAPENIHASGAVAWEDIAAENKQLFVEFVTPDVCAMPGEEPDGDTTAYQVDFVLGEPEDVLGEHPEDFYRKQGRLLRYLHGSDDDPVIRTGSGEPLREAAEWLDSSSIDVEDGVASVSFSVASGYEETLSLVSYHNPAGPGTFDAAVEQEAHETATGTFGPGDHTLTVDLPPTDG